MPTPFIARLLNTEQPYPTWFYFLLITHSTYKAKHILSNFDDFDSFISYFPCCCRYASLKSQFILVKNNKLSPNQTIYFFHNLNSTNVGIRTNY